MELLIQQIVAGIATGGIYASFALALVFTFQATGAVNFAQGAMATFTTYVGFSLLQRGVPYKYAMILTLITGFLQGVFVQKVLVRPLRGRPILNIEVMTIGLILVFDSILSWIYTDEIQAFPGLFNNSSIKIGPIFVGVNDLSIIGVNFLVFSVIYVFLKHTGIGLLMRAVAQNPGLSRLCGIHVERKLGLGWGMAAVAGSVSAFLVAPTLFLFPHMMNSVLIYGFAAATLGGLTSPFGAVVGGVFVGVLENIFGTFIPNFGTELKFPMAMVMIVLVLVFRPNGLFGKKQIERV